ncbi:membrane metallo-endopeptidase-like 1 [Drosophila subobscura]|uniref:membrane metallo-endopeptidase-like 1 n=1 Tax=Drosophila subobscura TaxID=7241 RepID=UPI00155B2E1A|nr:membrane metallo-endopeptidase-like 1 [Drosophila subobscura]
MWIICLALIACATVGAQKVSNPNTRLLDNILSYVDTEVSACDDYFGHACGKYAKKHLDDPFTEITQMVDHKVNQDLLTLMQELEQRSQPPNFNLTSVEAKVWSFYHTCRNALSDTRSGRHYLTLVPPDEGLTWPQFTPEGSVWPGERFKWMETLARLHRYGEVNILMKVFIQSSPSNSSEYVMDLSMPSLEETGQRLRPFVETMRTLAVLGVPTAHALTLTKKIKSLETALRDIIDEDDDDTNGQYMTVRQLQRRTGVHWQKFIELLLAQPIEPQFRVNVQNLGYFKALVQLLNDREPSVVASYMMTRLMLYLWEETMDSEEPLECVKDVRRNMNLATSLLYKERFLGSAGHLQRNSASVVQTFEQLRRQFVRLVKRNRLRLDRTQRRMITQKVHDMVLNIGNMPQHIDHRRYVSQHYASLDMSSGDLDYARSHLQLLEFRNRQWMSQLSHSPHRVSEYYYITDSSTGMSSSPYYMIRQNVIIVPYGFLQEPVFLPDSHKVFKFSLLGFILAHELMHAFDGHGVIYDGQGNLSEAGLQIGSSARFEAGLECINRNETAYLNERVADMDGIKLAYDAYFGAESHQNRTQPDFTDMPLQRIFFLNLAQFFCGNGDASNFLDHDADAVRLKQTLANFAAFNEAFQCPTARSTERCQLW